jgi:hypothetical protein
MEGNKFDFEAYSRGDFDFYLTGHITANPDYKIDFADAEAFLTSQGYRVFNPARASDDENIKAIAERMTPEEKWNFYMSKVTPVIYRSKELFIVNPRHIPEYSDGMIVEKLMFDYKKK